MVRDEDMLAHGWLLTHSGGQWWPTDPRPEDCRLEDVAHALAHLCRYVGHVRRFYSVAEHSVHVSYMVPKELALEALLHDAAEAYIADIPRPLKRALPDYQRIERLNDLAVRTAFGLPHEEHPVVKEADTRILKTEALCLCTDLPEGIRWFDGIEEDTTVQIFCWDVATAEREFLKRYYEIQSWGPRP